MKRPILLLASASPRRRELVALIGLPFETAAPNVDESPRDGEPPAALAARLSRAKAEAVRSPRSGLVVACDTIVALRGEKLGKPRDEAEAEQLLRRLRGLPHAVYSGVTVVDVATGRVQTEVAETRVTMRPYLDDEIAAYVASGDPLDKAGAYAIQHAGFRPVAALEGCYANVVGLPLCCLARCLRAWGIEVRDDLPAACCASTGHRCLIYTSIHKSGAAPKMERLTQRCKDAEMK